MRGINLDEIATATKISTRNLRALEEEKFNQLPGGVFNKGFVRAYAKFLGIDEEHIVAEYEAASQDTEAAREQKLQAEFAKAEFRKPMRSGQEISLEPKSQWGTIAIIVLLAVLAYVGYSYYQRRKLDKLQQAQTPPPVVQKAVPPHAAEPAVAADKQQTNAEPAATLPGEIPAASDGAKSESATDRSGAATPTSAPRNAIDQNASSVGSAPLELKIKVNSESWVSIKADGKSLVSTTLKPGTERS